MRFAATRVLGGALAVLVTAGLPPGIGRAAEAPVRVAVPDIRVTGTAKEDWVEGLSTLILSEAGQQPGLEVVGSADMRAILGFEAERQLLGCGGGSCVAELAGALGVDYLLVSEVTKVGSQWILAMSLLDAKRGRAVYRANRRMTDGERLVDAAVDLVHEVLGALPGVAPAPVARRGGGRTALAWSLTAAGVAAVAAGGLLTWDSWRTYDAWQAGVSSGSATVTGDDISRSRLEGPLGWGLVATGVALAATSFLLPARPEGVIATVAPAPGGLVAGVRIPLE